MKSFLTIFGRRGMNTILQQAVSFRAVVPIFLTLSVAPHYLFTWSLWRALSSILPSTVYRYVDDKMYDVYQTVVVFFFENYAGTDVSCQLVFYSICFHRSKASVRNQQLLATFLANRVTGKVVARSPCYALSLGKE